MNETENRLDPEELETQEFTPEELGQVAGGSGARPDFQPPDPC